MIRLILFLTVFLFPEAHTQKLLNPPGTVKIRENLYMDVTEMCNTDYREYTYWVQRIFGKDSKEYKDALIDSSKISNEYHKHPKYNYFPLVAVTYEQAVAYCKWRSDRVFESMLIDKRIIEFNLKQNRDSYFSIEKVLTGKIKVLKPEEIQHLAIPQYRLPTIEEWEFAAGVRHTVAGKELFQDSVIQMSLTRVDRDRHNSKSMLLNMQGNVAEMVSEKGIAKGCTNLNGVFECNARNYTRYSKPERWLGFRCVCEYKYLTPDW